MGNFNSQKGFTLLEAIVYVFIFTIIIGMVSAFSFNLIKTKNKLRAERQTYQEAVYILQRITSRVRQAPGIDTGNSDFGQAEGKLILKSPTITANLTQFYLEDDLVWEKIGDATAVAVSSDRMTVQELRFEQVVSSDTQSSIEINIQIDYNDQGRADLTASTTLSANASLRNNYPYSWTQTDWSGGDISGAWEDPTKYESGSDIDVGTCQGDVMLGNDPEEIVIHASQACQTYGDFHKENDTTAADNIRIDDTEGGDRAGGHFGCAAESSPANYTDFSFNALADTLYHLWIRLKVIAEDEDDWGTSDSLYLQFSDSINGSDEPINRIGTSQALVVSYQDDEWDWDNIWTGCTPTPVGDDFYLEETGAHTVRVQRREDGYSFDQILISSTQSSQPDDDEIFPLDYQGTGEIISSGFDTGAETVFGQLNWVAYTPPDTSVKFQIRTAEEEYDDLALAEWYGPTSTLDYYTESGSGINFEHDGDQWIQYKVILESLTDSTITPILSSVEISYSN